MNDVYKEHVYEYIMSGSTTDSTTATPGKVTFGLATALGLGASLNSFLSVLIYLIDQEGCGRTVHNDTHTTVHSPTPVENALWASYSWVAIAAASLILLSLITSYAKECAGELTIKVSSGLSIVLLTTLCVLSGLIAGDADVACPGDSHDGLFGMSVASCVASGLAVVLWIATIVRKENHGKQFSDLKPRYRRARQFP